MSWRSCGKTFRAAQQKANRLHKVLQRVNKDLKQNDNEPIEAAFVKKNAISEQLFILEQVFQSLRVNSNEFLGIKSEPMRVEKENGNVLMQTESVRQRKNTNQENRNYCINENIKRQSNLTA